MNKWAAEDLFGPLRSSLPEEQEAYKRMIKELSNPAGFNILNLKDENIGMNNIEVDYCDICHKKKQVRRKYYYYDINCDCCGSSRGHFEIVRYCDKCTPKPPKRINIVMEPYND